MFKSNYQRRINPTTAPNNGVIIIDPLPTTFTATIALGPTILLFGKTN